MLLRAEMDLQRIYNRCDRFLEGRGELFLNSVDRAFAQLTAFPESAPVLREPYRRLLLRGFSYALVYAIEGNRVMIYMITSLKQNPDQLFAILDDPDC